MPLTLWVHHFASYIMHCTIAEICCCFFSNAGISRPQSWMYSWLWASPFSSSQSAGADSWSCCWSCLLLSTQRYIKRPLAFISGASVILFYSAAWFNVSWLSWTQQSINMHFSWSVSEILVVVSQEYTLNRAVDQPPKDWWCLSKLRVHILNFI